MILNNIYKLKASSRTHLHYNFEDNEISKLNEQDKPVTECKEQYVYRYVRMKQVA